MMAIKGLELPLNKKNDLVNAIKKSGANSGGNGVIIVDNVNKLDPNAKVGSMACVAIAGSIKEKSFKDLYQPDASILDQTAGTFTQPELLSSVSCINFLTPTDYSGVNTFIYLGPITLSQTDMRMMHFGISYSNGVLSGVICYYANQTTGEEETYFVGQVVDGVYTIDNTAVTAINNILASDYWCYLGYEIFDGAPITKEQFATLDKFAMAVVGVPSITDIYVKGDKWEQLYKNYLDKIKTIEESKADKIAIVTHNSQKGVQPNVYTTHSISSSGVITIKLAEIEDVTIYNEYILELKCTSTPTKVIFNNVDGKEATIVWANGVAPAFEAGMTYLISIANGFGVYTKFLNS